MTLKKVGDDIRKRILAAQKAEKLGGMEADTRYEIPRVEYAVRVSNSKTKGPSVNITINRYDWMIPDLATDDGAVKRWADTDGAALIAEVDRIAARDTYKYGPSGASVLGGVTELGLIVRAYATGVTHVSSRDES